MEDDRHADQLRSFDREPRPGPLVCDVARALRLGGTAFDDDACLDTRAGLVLVR